MVNIVPLTTKGALVIVDLTLCVCEFQFELLEFALARVCGIGMIILAKDIWADIPDRDHVRSFQ